jgi:hypothetical protein
MFVVGMGFFSRFLYAFDIFRIGDRTRDNIPATGPFPEIDQLASFATEREVRRVAKYQFATRWAAQGDNSLSGHTSILDVRGINAGSG